MDNIQKQEQSVTMTPPPPPLPPPLSPPNKNSKVEPSAEADLSFAPPLPSLSVPKDLRKHLTLPPPANGQNSIFGQSQSMHNVKQGPVGSTTYPFVWNNASAGTLANYYGTQNPYYSSMSNGNGQYYSGGGSWPTGTLPYQRRGTNMPPGVYFDPAMHGIISQLAEEKSRPTFSSIERILEAFSSINMILDSTYSAIHGTFRTITGVADHMIFVRNHLAEIAFLPRVVQIVIRFLRWLLQILGLDGTVLMNLLGGDGNGSNASNNVERIWDNAFETASGDNFSLKQFLQSQSNTDDSGSQATSPLWPIFVFFSLVLGTPYIVWRLLGAPGTIPATNQPEWTRKQGRHYVAVALYDFKARNQNELPFVKNQVLYIKPESLQPGCKWLVACHAPVSTGENIVKHIGLIPLNYVKLVMK